jgi:hypothetical protein
MTAERDILHPPEGSNPPNGRVSWFEMFRRVIANTMHASGAICSSEEFNSAFALYGPLPTPPGVPPGDAVFLHPRFDQPTTNALPTVLTHGDRSMPGGPLNQPDPSLYTSTGPGSQHEIDGNEWYPAVLNYHQTYMMIGLYSVLKRVYSWVDSRTQPSTTNNAWWTSLRTCFNHGRLMLRVCKVAQNPQHYFVPTHLPITVGDFGAARTANSTGKYGRFNATPNPYAATVTQQRQLFWWPVIRPLPPVGGRDEAQYYDHEFPMQAWIAWRVDPLGNRQALDDVSGLFNAGSVANGPTSNAAAFLQILADNWLNARANLSTDSGPADDYGWFIQAWRNAYPTA